VVIFIIDIFGHKNTTSEREKKEEGKNRKKGKKRGKRRGRKKTPPRLPRKICKKRWKTSQRREKVSLLEIWKVIYHISRKRKKWLAYIH
jgi:hypothetical protein